MTKKRYPCDICEADQPLPIGVFKQYNPNEEVVTCGNCGFVYVPNRRSAQEIADSWSHQIFQKGYTAKIPYVLARQTYVADQIDVSVSLANKSICDIGAGEGQFLEICRKNYPNVKVFGIEPSKANIEILKSQNISCFEGTVETFRESSEFSDLKFDIVTMMWTVEACLDCNAMIRTAYEMLKEGGHIVVATGSRILVPFKKPLNMYFSNNPADTHPFRFSPNSLTNVLQKNRFGNIMLNRFVDGDFLVGIGQKTKTSEPFKLLKDDPQLVLEFFDRWHEDTLWYKKNHLIS